MFENFDDMKVLNSEEFIMYTAEPFWVFCQLQVQETKPEHILPIFLHLVFSPIRNYLTVMSNVSFLLVDPCHWLKKNHQFAIHSNSHHHWPEDD
jgi:hypothetical protein